MLGLGPIFTIQLEVENLGEEALFGVGVLVSHGKDAIRVIGGDRRICMLAPYTPTAVELQV